MFWARGAVALFFEPDLKNLPELSDTLKKSVSIIFYRSLWNVMIHLFFLVLIVDGIVSSQFYSLRDHFGRTMGLQPKC